MAKTWKSIKINGLNCQISSRCVGNHPQYAPKSVCIGFEMFRHDKKMLFLCDSDVFLTKIWKRENRQSTLRRRAFKLIDYDCPKGLLCRGAQKINVRDVYVWCMCVPPILLAVSYLTCFCSLRFVKVNFRDVPGTCFWSGILKVQEQKTCTNGSKKVRKSELFWIR